MAALAFTVLGSSIGPAAAQEKPFRLTCEGPLASGGGQYFFAEGDKPLNADSDDNIVCAHVTIAENSSGAAVRESQGREHRTPAGQLSGRGFLQGVRLRAEPLA
jgi:hypothetical protein